MRSIKCPYCQEEVKPQGKNPDAIEWIVGIVLLFIGVIPGVIYLMWKGSGKVCPQCDMKLS